MPYINSSRREEICPRVNSIIDNPGELNYAITMLVKYYLANHGLSYQTINDIGFALEGAKLEFYRRVAAPYEDEKIQQNGDVY